MSVLPLCHSVERIVIFDRAVKRRENDRLSVYFDEWETAEAPAGAAAEVEQRRLPPPSTMWPTSSTPAVRRA